MIKDHHELEQPLTKADAQRRIRGLALLDEGIGFRGYAMMRMQQRHIDALEVVRALKSGVVPKPAYKRNDEWRYQVESKGLTVIVVIESDEKAWVHNSYRPRPRGKGKTS